MKGFVYFIISLIFLGLVIAPTYFGAKKYCETKSIAVLYAYVIAGQMLALIVGGVMFAFAGASFDAAERENRQPLPPTPPATPTTPTTPTTA